VDLSRAHIARTTTGAVRIDDPTCPWVVWAWTDERGRLRRMHVDMRPDSDGGLTAHALRGLPVGQVTHAARTQTVHYDWPNEALYRLLAVPRPAGQRGWDEGHWERVLAVYDWATASGRPGGGASAVAQMWGVALDPTAYRWLGIARARRARLAFPGDSEAAPATG
jgi:hypothetical protein